VWTGTWYGSGWSDTFTLNLKIDNTFTGTFRQPLEAYDLSGTAIIPVSGTYSFDSVNKDFTFEAHGTTVIGGYSIRFSIDGSGYTNVNSASGNSQMTSEVYYNGSWYLWDDNVESTWVATHP
jgi:hypothetical protein